MTDYELSEKLKGFDSQNAYLLFGNQEEIHDSEVEEEDEAYSENYSEEQVAEEIDESIVKSKEEASIEDY